MKFLFASVPFINAKPLVQWFMQDCNRDKFTLTFDIPSKLPSLIDNNQADAVLTSSFDSITQPDRKIAEGASISSYSGVQSVMLFSKVPPRQIQTLALDESSLTSNHLAQIILAEAYGVKPRTSRFIPNIDEMLKDHDACIIIGDNCLTIDKNDCYALDLGKEWLNITGLPFVWALWTGSNTMTEEIVAQINLSKEWGIHHIQEIVKEISTFSLLSEEAIGCYLMNSLNYDFTPQHFTALQTFKELLLKHSLVEKAYLPEIVRSPALNRS